jgi:hypothetical protein
MSQKIVLEKGEVKELPVPKHHNVTPLVARTDDVMGTGEELIVVTPGKNGLRILPYGSVFLDYEHLTNVPIFELPDGTYSNTPKEKVIETEAPTQ